MASSCSVCTTVSKRPEDDMPNVTKRRSSIECSWSSAVAENGSKNTLAASSNATSCFRRFAAALRAFHAKRTRTFHLLQYSRWQPEQRPVRRWQLPTAIVCNHSIWKKRSGNAGWQPIPIARLELYRPVGIVHRRKKRFHRGGRRFWICCGSRRGPGRRFDGDVEFLRVGNLGVEDDDIRIPLDRSAYFLRPTAPKPERLYSDRSSSAAGFLFI